MSAINAVVKWGKKTIEISVIPSDGVMSLKSELEDKTGVPKERMKLMPKSKGLWKGILKDDFDLTSIDYTKFKSSSPIQILLMGSASKLSAPKVKTVFLEDLPAEEAAKVAAEPSGLMNLGNTCYLNSVVQCLRAIPVLRSGLTHYANANNSVTDNNNRTHNQSHRLFLSNLRDLYRNLDRTANPVTPSPFVLSTKMAFPQFAQTGPGGAPMQQDAEEFYSGLLTIAAGETKGNNLIKSAFTDTNADLGEKGLQWDGVDNLIDALFGIQMEETLTCDELEGAVTMPNDIVVSNDAMDVDSDTPKSLTLEPPVTRHDLHRKLVCNIQGGSDTSSNVNVNHIMEGISLSLNGKVQKRSEVLGRDAIWTRKQSMARLPSILMVQFGRFYWKETPDSQDHAGVKCKVMKPVAFQGILDVYEFCSEKVQASLKVARDQALKDDEEEINRKLAAVEKENKLESEAGADAQKGGDAGSDAKMTGCDDEDEEDEDLKAAMAMSMQTTEDDKKVAPTSTSLVGPGLPQNFQGKYELFAVVTHKGRDADGGHYMGWVKAETDNKASKSAKIADTEEDNDDWFVFDDDEVAPCKMEDVLKLKGGGDWHMSYLNFYRAKK